MSRMLHSTSLCFIGILLSESYREDWKTHTLLGLDREPCPAKSRSARPWKRVILNDRELIWASLRCSLAVQ